MCFSPDLQSFDLHNADVMVPPIDLWSDEPPLESDWHREQLKNAQTESRNAQIGWQKNCDRSVLIQKTLIELGIR